MEINTNDLQKELQRLNQLITDWETCQLNLYRHLDKATSNWQDADSIKFSEQIVTEKNNTEKVLDQVKDLKSLYQYLYNNYSKLGQKIYCDTEARRNLTTQIDNYYDNLKKIYHQFDDIDMSFSYKEKSDIIDIKNKLERQLKKLEELKRNVLSFLDKVEEIEREVSVRISRFQDILISDFDMNL